MTDQPTPAEGEPGHPYGSAPWIKRETVEEAMENDCPGDCGPEDHCGEHGTQPAEQIVPYPLDITDTRPPLPLDDLVDMGVEMDGDYCDGDCSGFHSATFEHGVLTLEYTPDAFSTSITATAQFVEVGMLLTALRIADSDGHDEYTDWRLVLSNLLGVELRIDS